jgi:hypothetical protein
MFGIHSPHHEVLLSWEKKPHGNHNILDGEHHGPTKHILNMPLFWGRDLIYLNVHLMCYLHKSLAESYFSSS